MIYIAGIDGGATKTHCVIGDTEGNVLSEGLSSSSSYHAVGLDKAKEAIKNALLNAAEKIGISEKDLGFTLLGLASADLPSDFEALEEICGRILPRGKYRIINDTWVGLRAGLSENWGIVTNCGTGGSFAGRNKDGEEVLLRNLSYEIGNRGGGADIAVMALHYAFRSNEGTGRKTALEREIPRLAGLKSLDDIVKTALSMNIAPEDIYGIPVLVGKLACEDDAVCQDIFIHIGHEMGEIAGGVAKRLRMDRQRFKVTLTGSVFKSECPLLLDEYTTTLHRAAPYADITVSKQLPAMGAYWLACDEYKRNC